MKRVLIPLEATVLLTNLSREDPATIIEVLEACDAPAVVTDLLEAAQLVWDAEEFLHLRVLSLRLACTITGHVGAKVEAWQPILPLLLPLFQHHAAHRALQTDCVQLLASICAPEPLAGTSMQQSLTECAIQALTQVCTCPVWVQDRCESAALSAFRCCQHFC